MAPSTPLSKPFHWGRRARVGGVIARVMAPKKVEFRKKKWVEPEALFDATDPSAGFVWLDSSQNQGVNDRWSFMMKNPYMTVTAENGIYAARDREGTTIYTNDDPFDLLEEILSSSKISNKNSAFKNSPFIGGAVGFLGYDLLKFTEPSTLLAKPVSSAEGDLWFGFYDRILAFDQEKKEVWQIASVEDGDNPDEFFDDLESWLSSTSGSDRGGGRPASAQTDSNEPTSNFSAKKYQEAVEKVREYILAGDCYQANIAQRFSVADGPEPPTLYKTLRAQSPAPFAAYIVTNSATLLSNSPERFIKLSADGKIEARPIKGTRPRGGTAEEDEALLSELAASPKERAENIMIVDLVRNDLSKIALPGSVKVTELCVTETFPTVFHLTSTIEGKLRPGLSAIDLFRATFPCGSVTGTPKIRAMEIIDEIEPDSRGVYCGAIGYIGFDGASDMSVAIRVVVAANGDLSYYAGGGVTWLSDPAEEYEETLTKAKAIREAIYGNL